MVKKSKITKQLKKMFNETPSKSESILERITNAKVVEINTSMKNGKATNNKRSSNDTPIQPIKKLKQIDATYKLKSNKRKPTKRKINIKAEDNQMKVTQMNDLQTIHYVPKKIDNYIHQLLNPIEIELVSSDDEEDIIETIDDLLDCTQYLNEDFLENVHIIKPIIHNIERKQKTVIDKPRKLRELNKMGVQIIEQIIIKPKLVKAREIQNNEIGSSKDENEVVVSESIDTKDCDEIEDEFIETGRYTSQTFKDGIALFLEENASIHMYGLLEITVLYGAIEIYGKRLDCLSPTVKVYSPRGSAFLSITNLNFEDKITKKDLTNNLYKSGLTYTEANEFVRHKFKPAMAVLICKKLKEKQITFLKDNIAQTFYPIEEDEVVNCQFRNFLKKDWNLMKINPEWNQISDDINQDSKIMLCGGKGVGKSTALRYLVNRLLEKYPEILVIDLDPGQPEFTVPGCISAIIVKQALLGPNYTHLTKPEISIFISNIDISNNHDNYLLCVQKLMIESNKLINMPTIINFMGFTRGIGLNIAASAISITSPTKVIQICAVNSSRNFIDDLTIANILEYKTLLTPDLSDEVSYDLIKIKSMCCNGVSNWELEPRQVREMCILSYISQILPINCDYLTERDVKIYKTSLADVTIMCNGIECSPMVVNANIVSLCSILTYVNDVPIFMCHGFGIVRGYSNELNFLNLLTPLNEDELENVDHLLLGSITLPPSVYFRNHKSVTGVIPYVYQGKLANFARTPKRSMVHTPKK